MIQMKFMSWSGLLDFDMSCCNWFHVAPDHVHELLKTSGACRSFTWSWSNSSAWKWMGAPHVQKLWTHIFTYQKKNVMFHESQRFRQHAKHCYLLPSLLRATVWAVSHELICAVSSLHKHALLIFSVSFLASYLTRTRAANLPHKTSTPATGCTKGYHTSYI